LHKSPTGLDPSYFDISNNFHGSSSANPNTLLEISSNQRYNLLSYEFTSVLSNKEEFYWLMTVSYSLEVREFCLRS